MEQFSKGQEGREEQEMIKRTPLYNEHLRLGAKMFEFAGWEMPLQYSSVKEEHFTVREKAGLFDVSHMGQVFITGSDALKYLQNLVPQDLSKLEEGKAVYTALTNDNGGIIDDLIIYRLPDNGCKFLLIINAARIENDLNRLLSQKGSYDVVIDNKSNELSMIALQGPLSSEIISDIGISDDNIPKRFRIKEITINGMDAFIARTGYTGEDGFEIIVKNEDAERLWQDLLNKGEKYGLKPVGYAARDTLRLEAALPLYGQDLTEETTPVEASLSWTIPKEKQESYAGKDIILAQFSNNMPKRKLVGFKMLDKSVPRHDYEVFTDNEKVGRVTSGGFSPCGNVGIGLAYIDTTKHLSEGAKINIMIRGKLHPAKIVKTPFYSVKKSNK
ncbi:MAG: glycine cleavage system aminomethyltransferase GcvT [Candidatus Gastranaerophilales bacterium]|nr:glycine cleavage system aminomethyltransferase GcvT [Candidatus Gastranaerophilales bacterium]